MAALPAFTLPLPVKEFLARHWQREPLFMPGAATGLDHPEPDLLASLALDEEVESRIVSGGADTDWQLRHGPFSEADFASLGRRDWTLLVQSVDHYLTEVSLLLDSFSFLPAWRLEDIMISYAAPGGGVGPHFDRYDVFLIQARGRRRWALGPRCNEDTPLRDHPELRLLQDAPRDEVHEAGPGDVLYLPPGVAHEGVALDGDCVTWSVGLRAPARRELLAAIAAEVLEDGPDDLLADAGREPAAAPGLLEEADVARMLRAVSPLLDTGAARRGLARTCSTPRQYALDFGVDTRHIRAATEEAVLVRHGAARLLLDGNRAWINGQCRTLTPGQRPLAELLAERRLYHRQALEPLMNAEATELMNEWISEGYFVSLE